jgi:prepilin-type N-terminal cleavage/methylation domain-containing protein
MNHDTCLADPAVQLQKRRGFSLVEVLMAVLILGLGLLGLGAIMPAVVKQQRTGTDQTFGTLAAESVVANFTGGNQGLTEPRSTARDFMRSQLSAWSAWSRSLPTGQIPLLQPNGTLQNRTIRDETPGTGAPSFVPTVELGYNPTSVIPVDGSWRILTPVETSLDRLAIGALGGPQNVTQSLGNPDQEPDWIPMSARLWPTVDRSDIREPQFVWDIAVRRKSALREDTSVWESGNPPAGGSSILDEPGAFDLQAVVFIRRVDANIRTRNNLTPLQAMVDVTLATNDRKWPVSERNSPTALAGQPTGDGSRGGDFAYSPIARVNAFYPVRANDGQLVQTQAELNAARVDVITLTSQGLSGVELTRANNRLEQIAQNGQFIVDNAGNVYRVEGRFDPVNDNANDGDVRVIVSPPPPLAFRRIVAGGTIPNVLATSQAPAAVRVIDLPR